MLLFRLRGAKRAVCDQYAGLLAKADGRRNETDFGGNMAGLARAERGTWWAQTATC